MIRGKNNFRTPCMSSSIHHLLNFILFLAIILTHHFTHKCFCLISSSLCYRTPCIMLSMLEIHKVDSWSTWTSSANCNNISQIRKKIPPLLSSIWFPLCHDVIVKIAMSCCHVALFLCMLSWCYIVLLFSWCLVVLLLCTLSWCLIVLLLCVLSCCYVCCHVVMMSYCSVCCFVVI